MRLRLTVVVSGVLAAVAVPVAARSQDASDPDASVFTQTPALIENLFGGRVRPTLGGVAPGGGLGAGLSIDVFRTTKWRTTLSGMGTPRQYWSGTLVNRYESDRVDLSIYGRVRDMTELNYFGPGRDSRDDDRVNFQMRDPSAGVRVCFVPNAWFSLGGRVEALWPSIGRGRDRRLPSIDDRYTEFDAPALTAQPRFDRYDAFVEIDAASPPGRRHERATYRGTYSLVADRDLGRYSFRRLEVEVRHQFAGVRSAERLTLHGWLSTADTDPGHDVPFFFQPTLGGRGQLRSVQDQLLGGDGTRATLRGFPSFRFRDRHAILLQAEYRIPVWGPIDTTVFVDAGQVAARRADLGLRNLKSDYGFSINLMRKTVAAARLDVAFGSGEGTRYLLTLGDFIP